VLELMFIMVALTDGQGVLSALLFGLNAANMAVLRRFLEWLRAKPEERGEAAEADVTESATNGIDDAEQQAFQRRVLNVYSRRASHE